MRKEIDQLSKNLATGMSRRSALWRFVTGIGAVGALGALTSKKAKAKVGTTNTNQITLECEVLCATQMQEIETICHKLPGNNTIGEVICNEIATTFYDACIVAAANCASGFCPVFEFDRDDAIDTTTYNAFVDDEGDFVCVYIP